MTTVANRKEKGVCHWENPFDEDAYLKEDSLAWDSVIRTSQETIDRLSLPIILKQVNEDGKCYSPLIGKTSFVIVAAKDLFQGVARNNLEAVEAYLVNNPAVLVRSDGRGSRVPWLFKSVNGGDRFVGEARSINFHIVFGVGSTKATNNLDSGRTILIIPEKNFGVSGPPLPRVPDGKYYGFFAGPDESGRKIALVSSQLEMGDREACEFWGNVLTFPLKIPAEKPLRVYYGREWY